MPKPTQRLGLFDLTGLLAAAVPPGMSLTVEVAGGDGHRVPGR
jgi:hypothetical protein